MAKTDKKLKNISDQIKMAMKTDVTIKSQKLPIKIINRFGRYIDTYVEDHRADWGIEYSLQSIIIMAFLAIIAGADSWVDIENFCKKKKKWLEKFVELPNGRTPCNDTFMRVFGVIDQEEFSKACVDFITENLSDMKRGLGIAGESGKRHIAIDGKQERGTGRLAGTDREIRDQQTLHFFDTVNLVCIVSKKIDEKTNEIPEAQAILEKFENMDGFIFSGDALHTQWKHTEIITRKGGDYVFGLKGNQSQLKEETELLFTDKYMKKLKKSEDTYFSTTDKDHNQSERREYYLSTEAGELPAVKNGKWCGLRSVLCVVKTIQSLVTGEVSVETRYYISSLTDIEEIASIVRAHWAVEIQHFYLDFVFHQDDNHTVDENAFQNFAAMNKICLTLIRIHAALTGNSVAQTRKSAGWASEETIAEMLNFYDEETLRKAMEAPLVKKLPRTRYKVKTLAKQRAQAEAAKQKK